MNQKIHNLAQKAYHKVKDCAFQERFLRKEEEFDEVYIEILKLLEQKLEKLKE